MSGPQDAPSCEASSSSSSSANGSGGQQQQQQQGQQQQSQEGEVHEVFGDVNLGAAMLFLMLLHLLKYTMMDPCSC